MKALKFRLQGKTACFRKAEFNAYAYFTYNNIHKPALLGILGAIVGYSGYNQQKKDETFPEYYERLRNLRVSIVPISGNYGVFPTKIQVFNNTVGYASQEEGGNLIVREQWLENPCWDIFVLDDGSDEFKLISDYILGNRAVYLPYLGKNDHPALISETEIVEVEKSDSTFIDSIVTGDNVEYDKEECQDETEYLVMENMPVAMDKIYNFAVYGKAIYTNYEYTNLSPENVYSTEKLNLYFF